VAGAASVLAAGVAAFVLDPRLGVAALGLPALVVVAASPSLGAALLLFVLPLEELASLVSGSMLTFHKLLGMAVIGAWGLRVLVRRERVRLPPTAAPLGALVLWGACSTLWSVDPEHTLRVTLTWLQLFGLYLLVVNVLDSPAALRRALYAHLAGASVLAVLGLYIAGHGILQAGRAAVVIDHELVLEPNAFAGALVLPVVIALVAGLDRSRGDFERIGVALAGGLCLTTIVLTLSRGPLLALATVTLLVSVARGRPWLVPGAVLLAAPGLMLVGPELWERLAEGATLADRGAGRLDIWRVGWVVVASAPVHGIGLGCFPLVYFAFLSQATGISWRHVLGVVEKMERYPHNIYVGTAAELGAVGLALLGGVLGAHLRAAWLGWRALEGRRATTANLALVGLAGLVALVVEGATFDVAHRKYFWLCLGLAALTPLQPALATVPAGAVRRAA
jgi:hypothetical protein